MGKSEVERFRPSPFSFHTVLDKDMNGVNSVIPQGDGDEEGKKGGRVPPILLPEDTAVLDNQVAGHMNDGRNFSMLKFRGFVLKPVVKKSCADRESNFYEELRTSRDSHLIEMRQFTPAYYGKQKFVIDGREVDCLILEDLTRGFKEPCIMDIKIGRRTWDPQATYQKILKEDSKYHDSKRDLGFCIPGFQIYKLSGGKVRRYGKEFGKSLNKDTIADAFRMFLNSDTESAPCRSLLVQLLVSLWRIQNWARKQTAVRLYSSSLLLLYDARRLRQALQQHNDIGKNNRLARETTGNFDPDYSAEIIATSKGKERDSSEGIGRSETNENSSHTNKTIEADVNRLNTKNNEKDNNFRTLEDLICNELGDIGRMDENDSGGGWAMVRMIDFAHAHRSWEDSKGGGGIDRNYLEGVESLVGIFEGFLKET